MPEFRNYALGVATFGLITFVALVIASFGMISLLANMEVVTEKDAGNLLGPVMIAGSALLSYAIWISIARRVPPENIRISIGASIGVGFAAYFGYIVVGAVGYVFIRGDLFSFAVFMAEQLVSPFAITAGLIGLVLTILYLAMLVRKARGTDKPHWPWEKDDDSW